MRFVKVGLIILVPILLFLSFALFQAYGDYRHFQEFGDPVKALATTMRNYDAYTRQEPNNAELWCKWGDALVNFGRDETDTAKKKDLFEQARQKAEISTKCEAKHAGAWMVWGHALYNLSETETDSAKKRETLAEAVTKYAEAARLKPDEINAWYNLGYMKRRLAAMEKGAERPGDEQDKKLDPEHGDPKVIFIDCARIAMDQGDKDGCRAMLEQCRKELGPLDERELQAMPAFDSVREEGWFKALCVPPAGTTSGM